MYAKLLCLFTSALLAAAVRASTDPNVPWSVCAANQNVGYPTEKLAKEVQGILDVYIDALNTCNVERFALLFTDDYFAYDGNSKVTSKAGLLQGFERFCSSAAFNVSRYSVENRVQVAWNVIYARIKVTNPNFKTCNAELPNSVVYPASMTFTPCWSSYKIRTEVYGISGPALVPLLTNDCSKK